MPILFSSIGGHSQGHKTTLQTQSEAADQVTLRSHVTLPHSKTNNVIRRLLAC